MGWLWSSTEPTAKSKEDQAAPTAVAEIPTHPTSTSNQPSETTAAPNPPQKRQLTRDEQAELEFRDLLKELDAPPAPVNSRPADSPAPREELDEYSIHPTNLYPRQMSCRAAFDQAFYCQSMGGQFVNVYRYGQMRSCSQHWSDFWFCMRTTKSGLNEQRTLESLKKHYWERERKYREGPSSEDVWEMRDKMVEAPFSADMAAHDEAYKPYREMMKRRYRNFINDRPLDAPEEG